MESGILLDGSKTPLKAFPNTEQNLSSTQDKDQNEPNFIALGKISEQEKIEIIQTDNLLNFLNENFQTLLVRYTEKFF